MPAPIDLSEIPSRPAKPTGLFGGRRRNSRGTGLAIDEYARKVMWAALAVSVLLLAYLLIGLYSGAWAKASMRLLYHTSMADYNRQMDNITFVFRGLQLSTLVFVIGFLICCLHDESVGYILLGTGMVFYAALPALTSQVYDFRGFKTSLATQNLMQDFQLLAWVFFAPGVIWTFGDLLRRFRSAAEAAAIDRANLKYGANVKKQQATKQKRVFLGRCYEGPYCRGEIRERCPVFLKKRGPCWWYKEGCMCEERIILQAVITKDWKHQAAKADAAYNFGQKRSGLTPAAKRQRCRDCVIYNEHQKQKYKALVAVTLVVLPVLLFLNAPALQAGAQNVLVVMDQTMRRFSFDHSPSRNDILYTAGLQWTVIGAVCVILLAQVLKFIEFCCFKIKI